jgi:hypothetical protein
MSALPWIAGGALVAYLYGRKKSAPRSQTPRSPQPVTSPKSAPVPADRSTAPNPPDIWDPPKPTPPTTANPPDVWDPPTAPKGEAPKASANEPLPGRWVWPVAKWRERKSVVSSGVSSPRPGGPHRGVDIMFRRAKEDPFQPNTPNGTKLLYPFTGRSPDLPSPIYSPTRIDPEIRA